MTSLILYALITPSLFYLGSRAVITAPLWSRYPRRISVWADCAACSGFWYGALVGGFGGFFLDLPFLGLEGFNPIATVAVALGSMTWTPIIAAFMQWGFETLGTTVDEASEEPESKT